MIVVVRESGQITFVLTKDGDVLVFDSVDGASSYVEAVDVEDGEYESFFTVDGQPLTPKIERDDSVRLIAKGPPDLPGLVERLRGLQERNRFVSNPEDPPGVANEYFRKEWERRWPRWPGWLDRRLHGEGPTRA